MHASTHPRFNVFGRIVEEHELAQFLEELFHESASPHNGDVHRIG